MNRSEQQIGKGSDDNLRRFRQRRERQRFWRKILIPAAAGLLLVLLTVLILAFGFVVRKLEVVGSERYTAEEILEECGIEYGDNLFSLSQKDVEERLKEVFPYIKSVDLKRDYPSSVTLEITEEYTTFCYEAEGEYFLFNHSLRLLEKFDSLEALTAVRPSIYVKIPLPKSCIVPQYIQMRPEDAYLTELIGQLSSSSLVNYVTSCDFSDKFMLKMMCGKGVEVVLGDYTRMEEKFAAVLRLLGDNGESMTGRIDLSDYPRCFYDLDPDYS